MLVSSISKTKEITEKVLLKHISRYLRKMVMGTLGIDLPRVKIVSLTWLLSVIK